jgi:single-strand DNA-binding protein
MAGSLNRVMIIGNLGQDPELRYTANQTPVATFSIATTDYRVAADGQRQETTEWHRVVVWSKMAENCAKFLAKGRTVFVEGKLQTRSWDDKQTGQKRYQTEIVAQNVQFLNSPGQRSDYTQAGRGANQSMPQANNYGAATAIPEFDIGAPVSGNTTSGFGGPETAGLDDIPF